MKQKRFFAVSLAVLAVIVAGVGFTLFSLRGTVSELAVEINRSAADAILAHAEIENESVVTVPILYYDQVADECADLYDLSFRAESRQFEWASCGYYNAAIEEGLAEMRLDEAYLPVASGAGELVPNRGVDFRRWFTAVPEVSKSYGRMLALAYDAERSSFVYEDEEFYPLDDLGVPEETVNLDGNNHLFTLNLGVPVSVLLDGREEFAVTADDDTFVYFGDTLVIDMGGIHEATTGKFRIAADGEVYAAVDGADFEFTGVRVKAGEGAIVRIFHADRNSTESVFKVAFTNMLLNITNSSLADGGGAQVAYDPENPSYVAPLGESLTVRPDKSQAVLVAAVIQITILGILMVCFVLVISWVSRYSRLDRIREE